MSVLDTATYVLDTPGALLRGLLAGKPGQRATGREALHLGPNKPGFDAGDIPGFLAELVLDPLTWIGGAGILKGAKYLNTARKARAASKATKAVEAVEQVAKSSNPLIASIDARTGEMREGMEWLGKHYGEKLEKTRQSTGKINVINERSGLPLWEDGRKGRVDLGNIQNQAVDVLANSEMEHAGHYVPGFMTIEYNPSLTKNYDTLKQLGIHEGQHYLNDGKNISQQLLGHIDRVNEAAKRMWSKRGYDGPFHMRKRPDVQGRSFLQYIMDPDEVIARVSVTRQGLEDAGLKSFTPGTYYRRPKMADGSGKILSKRSFPLSASELTDLPREARQDADLLLSVYGPKLVNHMLRVLPAAAVTTGGAYAAANAMSPRQAVSA